MSGKYRKGYHVWWADELAYLKKIILNSNFEIKPPKAIEKLQKKFPKNKKFYTYSSVASKLSEWKIRLINRIKEKLRRKD